MPARGQFKLPYPKGLPKLPTFAKAMKKSSMKPPVGVTQGGSSRKARGAKVAATDGQAR